MNKKFLGLFQAQIGNTLDKSPSKAARWLGGVLREVSETHMMVEYTVNENMCNPAKILHGGIATLMMDEVIGMANFIAGDEYLMSTINLSVDFLSSAKVGEKLNVKAVLVRTGANLNHWEAEITKESGKIVAKASSNMLKTHVKFSDLGLF